MSEICENAAPDPLGQMVGGMEFIYWLVKLGKSRPTGFRWRQKGLIATVNIQGKLFVTHDEITRFWQRARRGEFAKRPCGAAANNKERNTKSHRAPTRKKRSRQ
jgi:hypothetical protein